MRILVIEDDISIATFLKKNFEAESFAVDIAHDGDQGSYTARTNTYDVIILDNMLPKKGGLEVCQEIRGANNTTPIIMLSVKSDIPEKVKLLEAGIDDYLAKPYSFDELRARINSILRRNREFKSLTFTFDTLSIDLSAQTVMRRDKEIYLTRKEFSLLNLLLMNKGRVVSRGMIMEHVWDMDSNPLSRTIETHISNLRKKIETKKQKLIHNIPGRGYKLQATA